MSRQHYHSGSNVPGYLGEGDIATFTSQRAAASYAYQEARESLANRREYDEDRKSYLTGQAGDYYIESNDQYDLGMHFWVEPCNEPECRENDE